MGRIVFPDEFLPASEWPYLEVASKEHKIEVGEVAYGTHNHSERNGNRDQDTAT